MGRVAERRTEENRCDGGRERGSWHEPEFDCRPDKFQLSCLSSASGDVWTVFDPSSSRRRTHPRFVVSVSPGARDLPIHWRVPGRVEESHANHHYRHERLRPTPSTRPLRRPPSTSTTPSRTTPALGSLRCKARPLPVHTTASSFRKTHPRGTGLRSHCERPRTGWQTSRGVRVYPMSLRRVHGMLGEGG